MQSTFPESLREALRARLTQRGAAAVLALSVELLIVLLFLTISSSFILKTHDRKPNVFRIEEKRKEEKRTAPPIEVAKENARRQNGGGSNQAPIPNKVETPVPPVTPSTMPSNVLWLTRNDYRATDIAGRKGRADGPGQGNGTSAEADSSFVDGKGPHGERLFDGEWYRRPTNDELAAYWPPRSHGREGWGEIMCRTAPHYRVEDCQEIADWPRGSGFAGAARQAAWQFKFKPPRIGGKALIGAWIHFRVTYIITHAEEEEKPRPEPDDQ